MIRLINMKIKLQADYLLKLFLGIIFLSAGIYRIFNWQSAILEVSNLGLPFPSIISAFVVILEIIGALALLFNIQTKKALYVFSAFLGAALLWSLATSWQTLISGAGVLFTFNSNSTDFFLHFTYLIILLYLIFQIKNKK